MASSVFGNRPDLVELDEDGVGTPSSMAALQPLDVGDEDIVAHNLNASAQLVGKDSPACPVVLGQPSSSETMGYWRVQLS